jgi:hypothetical protein
MKQVSLRKFFDQSARIPLGGALMSGQLPRSRTAEGMPPAREHRGFRGIIGAVLVSLALWSFLMMAVLGLIFKILS